MKGEKEKDRLLKELLVLCGLLPTCLPLIAWTIKIEWSILRLICGVLTLRGGQFSLRVKLHLNGIRSFRENLTYFAETLYEGAWFKRLGEQLHKLWC